MVKTIEVKSIRCLGDLARDSQFGEWVLIGGNLELKIDPSNPPLNDIKYLKEKVYTVSIKGEYVFQKEYSSNLSPALKIGWHLDYIPNSICNLLRENDLGNYSREVLEILNAPNRKDSKEVKSSSLREWIS